MASPGNPYKYEKNGKEKSFKLKLNLTTFGLITKLSPNQIESEYPSYY
jgi:hypothetical protein